MVLASHGDHEAGMVACERAAAVAAESSEPAHQETALHYLALACVLAGQYERALALCEARRDICTGMGDAAGVALAWAVTGDACYGLARYADALAAYHQALPTFRDRSLPRYHALCLYKLGCAHHSLGRHDEAVRYLEASLPLFRNLDPPAFAQQAERALHACRHPTAGPRHLPIHARAVGGQPLPGAPLAGCGGVTRAG
jgi:tetratricopeptide (TPR) repeat protein